MRRCGVCGKLVPGGVAECPRDGAPASSFDPIHLTLRGGATAFRVSRFPFAATRQWAKDFFHDLVDPDGAPAHRYLKPDVAAFRIDETSEGFRFRSSEPAGIEVNHFRIDGVPVGASGITVSEAGRRLELWSARLARVVMTLQIELS
jgi:hypothetical protein